MRPTGSLRALLSVRLVANVFHRFPYVLLTPLSGGLGVSVGATTTVLGLRELGGLASPMIGRWADAGHARRAMTWCAAGTGLLCLAVWAGPPLWLFAVVMVLSGVSKTGNDVSQSAWIAHRVPFERRGRVLGFTELTWGGAFLVGIPACAWLTDRYGWRAPFAVLGVALVVGAAWLWSSTPPDAVEDPLDTTSWRDWRPPEGSLGLFGFAVLQPFAQMMVFAVAGDWFVTSLGMSLSGLGLNTALLGVGEVLGTLTSASAADRIGKRVAAMIGVGILVPCCAAMGLVGDRAVVGVVLLVVVAIGFELSWVSALPLFTEVAPDRRASMLGAFFAVSTVSRAISSAVSGWIYTAGGIATVGIVTSTVAAVLFVTLATRVTEPAPAR